MARLSAILGAVSLAAGVVDATLTLNAAQQTCEDIRTNITSASDIVYPIQSLAFTDGISHWFTSSTQVPECVFLPGTPQDLSVAIKIIAAAQTPFAVMSGGHASNPGFSSTTGVHISTKRFDQVVLAANNATVEVGTGNVWSSVFSTLEGTGYNVVGGRVPGPAVGGFTLGGGFSWKTNQFGLTCDTVKAYNIVLPNGDITQVTHQSDAELFFALKGGMNRFGIVTSVVLETHAQPEKVYGGFNLYSGLSVNALLNATEYFNRLNTDPKAGIITTLEGGSTGTTALVLFFYDGPSKPDAFKYFDGIIPLSTTVHTQTFSSFVSSIPAELASIANVRGTFHTFSTTGLTPAFLSAIKDQVDAIGVQSALHAGISISYDIEPFTNYGVHATDSAYPHANSPLPLNLYFSWSLASEDEWWYARMRQSVAFLKAVAISEGIYSTAAPLTAYPNYALFSSTANDLYGATNAARLHAVRNRVDPGPNRVMDLAGGFTM
ncbi:hypothetical protein B0T17DRAFT_621491 [Bombardia bombarda]|uniref:FAD-binding PCMH-type domain-containing protein n=1 Tax=Bombardia bombarda TaxID=252184 RepID=A0AA39U2E4_9PEZI|nr:hypothetical protein B0T17DRAFT_621491 [Bombardia bombarda]